MTRSPSVLTSQLRQTPFDLALLLTASCIASACGVVQSTSVDAGDAADDVKSARDSSRDTATARDARRDVAAARDARTDAASSSSHDAAPADSQTPRDAGRDAAIRRDAQPGDSTTHRDVAIADVSTRRDAPVDVTAHHDAPTDVTTHHDAPSDTTTHHDAPADATRADVSPADAAQHEASAPDVAVCAPPTTWCGTSCVNEQTDVHHCGSCDTDCTALANVNPQQTTCSGGVCALSCAPGYADCSDAGAGCTASLSSPATCGSCATACSGDTPACTSLSSDGGTADAELGCTSGCLPTEVRCNGVCVDEQTDGNNCGGCGVVCGNQYSLSSQCALARCLVTLADVLPGSPMPGPGLMVAVNSTDVYWVDQYEVASVPVQGGTPTTIFNASGNATVIWAVALTDTAVYWGADNMYILMAPLAGGIASTLVWSPWMGDMAVNATEVYWTDGTTGEVLSVPPDGGATSTIASGQTSPDYLALGPAGVYWTTEPSSGDDAVVVAPLDGGAPTTLASGGSVSGLAVDTNNVYWIASSGGADRIYSMPLVGGAISTLVSVPTPYSVLSCLTVDTDSVYWADQGTILRVPIGGGTPVTLAVVQDPVGGGFAMDSASLYWVNDKYVMKMTPK
jgi:hypothetical protein